MDNIDPVSEFKQLTAEFLQFNDRAPYPKFFSNNVFRYYLLLCDASRTDTNIATNIFERIQTTFGTNSCQILYINSAQEFGIIPPTDPWLNFLIPPGYKPKINASSIDNLKASTDISSSDPLSNNIVDTLKFETQSTVIPKRHLEQPHGQYLTQHDIECLRMFVHELVTNALVPWTELTLKTLHDQILQRSSLRSFSSFTKKIFGGGTGAQDKPNHTNHHSPVMSHSNSTSVYYTSDAIEIQTRRYADLALLFQNFETASQTYSQLVRQFQNDSALLYLASALEMFVYASFLQASGSQRSTYQLASIDRAINIYFHECQQYDLALRASLLNAESLKSRNYFREAEMCLLRLITDLSNLTVVSEQNTLTASLSKLLGKDDLTSAILIEQAALCFLHQSKPQLRKFSLFMARSAHRYCLAQQRNLAIRAFSQTLTFLQIHEWEIALDYINYKIGDQAFHLGLWNRSTNALNSIFNHSPTFHNTDRQSVIFKDYLRVLKIHLQAKLDSELPNLPIPKIKNSLLKLLIGGHDFSKKNVIKSRYCVSEDELPDCEEDEIEYRSFLSSYGAKYLMVKWPSENRSEPSKYILPEWLEGSDVSDLSDSDESMKLDHNDCPPRDWFYKSPGMGTKNFNLTPGEIFRRMKAILIFVPEFLNADDPIEIKFSHPQIFSFNNLAHEQPLAPIDEQITFFIPLSNNLSVPLLMTDLRLLWRFIDRTVEPATKVDNRELSASTEDYVITKIVPEFTLLPGETKSCPISLTICRLGELRVVGLEYNLHQSNSHNNNNIAQNDASAKDLFVKGKINIRRFGKRRGPQKIKPNSFSEGTLTGRTDSHELDDLKNEQSPFNVLREPDFCLNILSCPRMPLLKVNFENVPEKMLQGQLERIKLVFTNLSNKQNLLVMRLISSWPGFFSISQNSFSNDKLIDPFQDIDKMVEPCGELVLTGWIRAPHFSTQNFGRKKRTNFVYHSSRNMFHSSAIDSEINIPPPNISSSTIRKLLVSISYRDQESSVVDGQHGKINTLRLAEHFCSLEFMPSLQFEALASRTYSNSITYLSISIKVQNVFSTSNEESARFRLKQISCISPDWTISRIIFNEPTSNPWFGKNECLSLIVYCTLKTKTKTLTFSNLKLNQEDDLIDLSIKPYSEFCLRSGGRWQLQKLRPKQFFPAEDLRNNRNFDEKKSYLSAQSLNLSLVVMWEYQLDSTTMSPSNGFGQSHIVFSALNRPVRVPLSEFKTTSLYSSSVGRMIPSSNSSQAPIGDSIAALTPLGSLPNSTINNSMTSSMIKNDVHSATKISTDLNLKSVMRMSKLIRVGIFHPYEIFHDFRQQVVNFPDYFQGIDIEEKLNQICSLDQSFQSNTLKSRGTCFAKIKVKLEIFNASSSKLLFRLETLDPQWMPHSTGVEVSTKPTASKLPGLLWTKLTLHQYTLKAEEHKTIELEACIPRPGVYEVNSLIVKAAFLEDSTNSDRIKDAVFIRQDFTISSPLIVRHISNDL